MKPEDVLDLLEEAVDQKWSDFFGGGNAMLGKSGRSGDSLVVVTEDGTEITLQVTVNEQS